MQLDQQVQRSKIEFTKCILQTTGTFNPMFSRPYVTHIGRENMDSVLQRVERAQGGTITGALLSGVANSIVKPTATPGQMIPVPSGWNEQRCRFILEAKVILPTGTESMYYFQGYTNHHGISHGNNIDPNMEFYINSWIRVNRAMQYTPYGVVSRDIVTESAQVINGQIYQQTKEGVLFGLRPQDIYTGIQSGYLSNAYRAYEGEQLTDTRLDISRQNSSSSRSNNISSNYVAKLIDTYQTGTSLTGLGQSTNDVFSQCHDLAYENTLQENPVMRAISYARNYGNGTSFTMNELSKIDPSIAMKVTAMRMGQLMMTGLHTAGQTANWNSVDAETLAAVTLSNNVPAIMMDLMLSKVRFRTTNHDIGGKTSTLILEGMGFSNADLTQNYEIFIKRLEKEILYDLSYSNQELYMIDMSADLLGETRISVSLNSGPLIDYAIPSFCDGLFAPIITTNRQNYDCVVHDLEVLMNNVNQVHTTQSAINTTI